MSKKNKKSPNSAKPAPTPALALTPETGDAESLLKGERDALSAIPPEVFVAEAQSQRWMKYGANVVLTTVVVLLLAAIAIWAFNADKIPLRGSSFSLKGRTDLTSDSSNELKPQTKQLIKDLPKEVTLVSLYPKLKKEEAANKGADTYQKVLDILDEYKRSGTNIKVEAIDPVNDPDALNVWLGQLKRTYSANIDKYEAFLKTEVPETIKKVKEDAEAEDATLTKMLRNVDLEKLTPEQSAKLARPINGALSTVKSMPPMLTRLDDISQGILKSKIPDYAEAVKVLKDGTVEANGPFVEEIHGMSTFRDYNKALVTLFGRLKDDKDIPEPIRVYAGEAIPRFQALHDKADAILKKAESLGELKLDDVRRKLLPTEGGVAAPPAIAIMTKDDVKVIEDSALWKSGQATGMTGQSNEKPRLRFAGEQQLTSAILAVAQTTKKKIAFVRAGGESLLTSGGMMMGMGGPGPYSVIADRLRAYNFDVVEKDFSPSPQQRPDPTQPSDEALKDAIWIVFAGSNQPDPRMGGMSMPGQLGEKLKGHLDAGGSALCLVSIETEDLAPALKDWGIEVRTNAIIVHDLIEGGTGAPGDFIESARRSPPIFILNDYGDHPLTVPLRTLDSAMVPLVPVIKSLATPAGVKVTPILPIPSNPKSWGETDLNSMRSQPGRRGGTPEFDEAADIKQPLFAGAVAEKEGKGRLVVIGTKDFIHNGIVSYPDQEVYDKTKMEVARFPGNGELLTNAVFWLNKQDSMMALSPAAMDTARIEAIPEGKLKFLKIGVVLILLPLLAVGAGITVWMTRRG